MRFGIKIFLASAFLYSTTAQNKTKANQTKIQTLDAPPSPEGELNWDRFFPFGASVCHTPQIRGDDNFSPQINLTVPFTFYGRQLDFLLVFTNGGLVNTTNFIQPQSAAILPLTIDVTIEEFGNIWYHQTTSSSVLECGTSLIRFVFPSLNNFIASWAFIGTWDDVPFFEAPSSRNTFQVVLLTDGSTSFAIFNYKRINTNGNPGLAGFTSSGLPNLFPLPGAFTPAIENLVNLSNIGIPGQFIYRVDGDIPTEPEISLCQPDTACDTLGIGDCRNSTPNCDSNAECIGDISIMTCSCKTGFTGDGFTCTDINECLTSGVCGQNADCTNTVGTFVCTCKSGFTGDGFNCTDVDECTDDACDQNGGKCVNTIGSFSCVKKCGFEPDAVCDFKLSCGSFIEKSRAHGYYGHQHASEGTHFLTTRGIFQKHISISTNILKDWTYCLRFAYYGSKGYHDGWKVRVDVENEIFKDVRGLKKRVCDNSDKQTGSPYTSHELFGKVHRQRTGHLGCNKDDWKTAECDIPKGHEKVTISLWKASKHISIALDDVSLVSGSCAAELPHP